MIKIINKNLLLSIRSSLNKNVCVILLVQNFRKKFEIKIYIRKEYKIKKIITITTNNIVSRIRKINTRATLLIYKNIIAIKNQSNFVIFRIKTKESKRILKRNNSWTKKILLNINLCEVNFEIVIHKIKEESMFKNCSFLVFFCFFLFWFKI